MALQNLGEEINLFFHIILQFVFCACVAVFSSLADATLQ